jgi:uncharacterized protein
LPLEKRKNITLSMNKVWQEGNKNLGKKVSSFKEKTKEYGFSVMDAFLGDRIRNSCYADKRNEAVINYNGDVYKCNARDFKTENREEFLNDQGKIVWNDRAYERMNIRLQNKPCFDCSILPICGGGCSQNSLDLFEKNYCVNDFDEERKKQIILGMFLSENLTHV